MRYRPSQRPSRRCSQDEQLEDKHNRECHRESGHCLACSEGWRIDLPVIVVHVHMLVDDLRPCRVESEQAKDEVGGVFVEQVMKGYGVDGENCTNTVRVERVPADIVKHFQDC